MKKMHSNFILDTYLSLFFTIRLCSATFRLQFFAVLDLFRIFIHCSLAPHIISRMIYYLVYNFDLFVLTFCALENLRPYKNDVT